VILTIDALAASASARRIEATAALVFHERIRELAAEVSSLDPDGRVMAAAAEAARAEAVEAVLLWRTAIAEMRRYAEHQADGRRKGTP
jgi:hypothetical protein